MRTLSVVAIIVWGAAFGPLSAQAASTFIEWSSTAAGSGGGIDATVVSTVREGEFSVADIGASDPDFVADFSDVVPTFAYRTVSDHGDIEATITFSAPLPTDAMLLVIDVDAFLELVILSSEGTPLTLIEQVESADGAVSNFPTYNDVLGELAFTAGGDDNDSEVSIFDLSGVTSIQVDFRNGMLGSGIRAAVALPTEVPEPGPVGLLLVGSAVLAAAPGRRNRR
ncbi:MAG: hypothetical protein ACR2PQ_02310 [Myxococcota bacterium]